VTEIGVIVRSVLVEGHVQGVGYREFVRRAALRLSVSGWVRNHRNGAVEALICGRPTAVESLIAEMRKGPRFAVVNSVSVTALDEIPNNDSGGFVILPRHRAEANANGAAADQPRRGDFTGLAGFVCDRSGPPAAVGVLDGGSLAGNDSSSSSSSLSSGFDCGLLDGDLRGSFIPAAP
jgi:acylphosphatase